MGSSGRQQQEFEEKWQSDCESQAGRPSKLSCICMGSPASQLRAKCRVAVRACGPLHLLEDRSLLTCIVAMTFPMAATECVQRAPLNRRRGEQIAEMLPRADVKLLNMPTFSHMHAHVHAPAQGLFTETQVAFVEGHSVLNSQWIDIW